jgi:hypothetical protein
MADENDSSGGFGWGLVVGLAMGVVAGAYLASGPGRDQVDSLRARTIELTGNARRVASDRENPLGRAINDGISAARRRRVELEQAARSRRQVGSEAAEALPTERTPDA